MAPPKMLIGEGPLQKKLIGEERRQKRMWNGKYNTEIESDDQEDDTESNESSDENEDEDCPGMFCLMNSRSHLYTTFEQY